MEGVHVVGADQGVWGKSPGSGSGGLVPQKLKQNVKLMYNF